MSETICAACGHEATGKFCSNCGAALPGRVRCASCDNEIPAGGRFCNQCGTPTAAVAAATAEAADSAPAPPVPAAAPAQASSAPVEGVRRTGSSTLPWTIAALAVLAVVIAIVFPRPGGSGENVATVAAPGTMEGVEGGMDASGVDISSMTPRERADALFNRVMQSVSSGDSTQARFFLPMALAAYDQVPTLDLDGHYHMAVLHLADGDPNSARARADSILAETPTHLFGLFTAAQAEQALGNAAEARAFYEQFDQAFAAESAMARTEYTEHSAVMPLMREEAAQALEGL